MAFNRYLARAAVLFILAATGRLESEALAQPIPGANDFQRVPIVTGLANAVDMAFAPDGRLFILNRYGQVLVHKPATGATVVAADIPVYSAIEAGVMGIAVDPQFASNGYIYLYYSPSSQSVNRLSRFHVQGDIIELTSEVIMLTVPTDRLGGHHDGSGLRFDTAGNLYLGIGDDTMHGNYAPLDETDRLGSAEKSSANTMDLRGKILRIHPEPNGTYTIPSGNLFATAAAGRPEIYVMGARNPYRFTIDPVTGWLFWGDIGPDAGSAGADGPAGYDEINLTKQAGNHGWPHFAGPNLAYRNTYLNYFFNPAQPTNDSRWNTGPRILPPAQPSWIHAPHQSLMAGPVYHFDGTVSNPAKLPSIFDGIFFYWDFNTSKVWYVGFNASGQITRHEPWTAVSQLGLGYIDMEIGPDHRLYVLEYGSGCCAFDVGNGVVSRFDYIGELQNLSPVANMIVDRRSGSLPLTVTFSSAGSFDPDGNPITVSWDFETDGIIDAATATATHTYTQKGVYNARLRVSDSLGGVSFASTTIHAGNNVAEVTFTTPPEGGLFAWNEFIDLATNVVDVEDGSVIGGTIPCAAVQVIPALGHLEHAHDTPAIDNCQGTVQVGGDHNLNGEDDLYYRLLARYRDSDGLDSFKAVSLFPKRTAAEFLDASNAVQLVASTDATFGASSAVRALQSGAYIVFRGRSLAGIGGVTYRIASGGAGGTIELRLDSPTGSLLASVAASNTGGFSNWTNVTGTLLDPGGNHDLYVVFKGDAGASNLFDIVSIEFLGSGISYRTPPVLTTVQVSPATASIVTGATQAFTATGRDQYGVVVPTPGLAWTVSGGGTLAATGVFTATTAGGPFTVRATSGSVSGTAAVTVTPQTPSGNLALGKPVVASSVEATGLEAIRAVDGSMTTRWSSLFTNLQWLYVDLGAVYSLQRVVLNWEAAYGRAYQIEVSTDAQTWVAAVTETAGNGATDDHTFTVRQGRYVRVYGTQRATAYGYSLFELQVFGAAGPPPVSVPNVVGLAQSAAQSAIVAATLTVGTVTQQSSPTVAAGVVISQTPAASSSAAPGSAVNLVVSSGPPPPVSVPGVVGLTQAAAQTQITAATLVVGTVTQQSSPTVLAGRVISQSPLAGSSAAAGSAVNLVVSSGPSPVTVPNVVGLVQTTAQSSIVAATLTVGTVTTQSSTTVAAGVVISQSPAGNSSAAPGSAVNLVVSSGAPAPTTNLALGKPAVASSVEGTNFMAARVVDGSTTTRWSSLFSDPQWVYVDLGAVYSVQRVVLTWEAAYGRAYQIQVSSNAQTWVTAFTTTTGNGATDDLTFPAQQGRYVRVYGTQRATVYGYSLFELQVFGAATTPVSVPSVVGLTQSAAQSAIVAATLTVGTVTQQSSTTVAAGVVISQSPQASSSANPGSAVSLVVSSGSPPVSVPNVVGLAQSAAQSAIVAATLTVGTVTQQSSPTVAAGVVISQTPAASSSAAPGSAVNLVVSSGPPPPVSVPAVVGLTQAAAQTQITAATLVVGTVTQQSSPTVLAGRVISQSPLAGSSAAAGSAVNLVVSSGPSPVTVPNVVGLVQTTAQSSIVAATLTVGTVTTQSSTTVAAGVVISQSPAGNSSAAPGSAVNLVVSSGAPAPTTNLALGKPAVASSVEGTNFVAARAVDGSTTTRWSSLFSDPQWVYVDLGAVYSVQRVVLTWEAAYGRAYQIQVSSNAQTWVTAFTTTTGNGAADDQTFPAQQGRYVRVYGTQRATVYGYSLFELQVFGAAAPPTPSVLTSLTVSPSAATVTEGTTRQFTANGFDQFGQPFATSVTWSVSGGGNINASGLFTALTVGGPFTVTASSGAVTGNAAVTVLAPSTTLSLDNWQTTQVESLLPWRAFAVASADLDGDNKKDIVAGGWWYKNPGTPTGVWTRRAIGNTLNNMCFLKDFDGDGDIDILGTTGAYTGVDLLWAENDGTGTFTVRNNVANGTSSFGEVFPADVAGGDFGGTTNYQLAISWNGGETNSSGVQLLSVPDTNAGVTNWPISTIHPVSEGEGLTAGDIDRDGDLDLFQGTRWLRNDGATWTQFTIASFPQDGIIDRSRLADLDGDGDLDAVVGFLDNNTRIVWLEAPANPTQAWTVHNIALSVGGVLSLGLGDMDNDGDVDVVLGEHLGAYRLIVFENVGNASSWVTRIAHPGGLINHHDGSLIVDIDNDGDQDVVSLGWDTLAVYLFENKAIN